MKAVTILSLLALGFILLSSHKCDWKECPANKDYEQFSDLDCIKQLHLSDPSMTYEECEYILEVDCKDVTIN
jgi:hypothetical protein